DHLERDLRRLPDVQPRRQEARVRLQPERQGEGGDRPVRGGLGGMSASGWRFPAAFWVGNVIELFERAAYYGVFIALAVYLTSVVGFTDVQAGWVGAGFVGVLYLLPFVTGALSDRIGFRPAVIVAFTLLTIGYAMLAVMPRPAPVLFGLFLAAVGGSF